MGQAVYGYFLADKEQTRMHRSDFIGVLKEEHIPLWAEETLTDWKKEWEIETSPQQSNDITQA